MPDRFRRFGLLGAGLLLLAAATAGAQTYLDLEDQVQEFTLDNGVKFLVLEHHDVPVFSFCTYVDVGSANEVARHHRASPTSSSTWPSRARPRSAPRTTRRS